MVLLDTLVLADTIVQWTGCTASVVIAKTNFQL